MQITENKINPHPKNEVEQLSDSTEKTQYDPRKVYDWDPNTMFVLSGQSFGLVLNTFRNILMSPEAQRILLVEKAHEAMEESLAKAVEAGVVREKEVKK